MTAKDAKQPKQEQDAKDAKQQKQEQDAKDAKRTAEEDEKIREAAHDHTVADSMIASDPPSSIPDPRDEDALEEQAHPPVKREEEEE